MRPNYDVSEVRDLIERYPQLEAALDTHPPGVRYLVRLTDLRQALRLLPIKYRAVVLGHGVVGIPQVELAEQLRISQQAVSKRYRRGLEEVTYIINGGID